MSDTTTPKRNEAVAWRRRYICPQEGPSLWMDCDECDLPTLRAAGCYEIEPLYSQEQMDALQGEVSRLRGLLSDTAGNLRRMANDEFADCEQVRLEAVLERIETNLEPPTDGR